MKETTTNTTEQKYIRQEDLPPLTMLETMNTAGFKAMMGVIWIPTILISIIVYVLLIKKKRR